MYYEMAELNSKKQKNYAFMRKKSSVKLVSKFRIKEEKLNLFSPEIFG